MTVLYRMHQLVDKDSRTISSFWKISIIGLCATALVGSLTASVFQGELYNGFGARCVLYSDIRFAPRDPSMGLISDDVEPAADPIDNSTIGPPSSNRIDLDNCLWGQDSMCAFCQYVPVMSAIMGLVWGAFFTMCPRGGRVRSGLQQPYRIVIPGLIFFSIMAVVTTIGAARVQNGLDHFCEQFVPVVNDTDCPWTIDSFTVDMNHLRLEIPAHAYVKLVMAGSWIASISWLLAVLLLVTRFCSAMDFELVTTTVTAKGDARRKPDALNKEEVEKLISENHPFYNMPGGGAGGDTTAFVSSV